MASITRRHLVAGMAAVPLAARAQSLPSTLRIIVPFPAGGSVDAVARQVQAGLQQRLGATVVIENQAGGSGSVGAARVANAPPDGGTWLFVFDSHAVNPFLQPLPFDSARDLDPVILIGTAPNVLARTRRAPTRAGATWSPPRSPSPTPSAMPPSEPAASVISPWCASPGRRGSNSRTSPIAAADRP